MFSGCLGGGLDGGWGRFRGRGRDVNLGEVGVFWVFRGGSTVWWVGWVRVRCGAARERGLVEILLFADPLTLG